MNQTVVCLFCHLNGLVDTDEEGSVSCGGADDMKQNDEGEVKDEDAPLKLEESNEPMSSAKIPTKSACKILTLTHIWKYRLNQICKSESGSGQCPASFVFTSALFVAENKNNQTFNSIIVCHIRRPRLLCRHV